MKKERRKFIKDTALIAGASLIPFHYSFNKGSSSYVKAPFEDLDTFCVNDWWERKDNQIINLKVVRKNIIAFGIYTLSNNILKLSAQTYPLYPNESRFIYFQIKTNNKWKELAKQKINEIGWSTLFRFPNWNSKIDQQYRLVHENGSVFNGKIRKDPVDKKIIKLAAFSCNSNKDRGDRNNYIKNVNHQDPDILFFWWGSVL
jgi:hypothetical protein